MVILIQSLVSLLLQMVSERQRIEGAPPPAVESSMPPPPSYEEINGVFMRNPTVAELVETVEFFLAEVPNHHFTTMHKFVAYYYSTSNKFCLLRFYC